ncbi:MAG: hypothetical protein IGR92_07140 [Leptolyngbyaceae cyanobacterium T60_A2020_046]|nr:hypothetical protein [Leptolyngbyaceae cyanobacterium T60_A2020_046]
MTPPNSQDRDAEQASLLLKEYSFDLGGYRPTELVALWQQTLDAEPSWIRAAVVEALYQGRYKAFSVEQILRMWKRCGHPLRHFNHDFERVVFGPVDPSASKYARMSPARPSELLTPQEVPLSDALKSDDEASEVESSAAAIADPTISPPLPLEPAAIAPEPAPPAHASTEEAGERASESLAASSPAIAESSTTPPNAPTLPAALHLSSGDFTHSSGPIRQFVPEPQPSEFYFRLQAVAHAHCRPFFSRPLTGPIE